MLETPFFLLREDILSSNIRSFQDALNKHWKNSAIAYSVKTNSLPWVLKWMNHHGIMAEVVSDDEYSLAMMAGFREGQIVYNGPIKTEKVLKQACLGGSIINIDSSRELDFFSRERPKLPGMIGVRVNVNPDIFDTEDIGYQEDGFRFGFCEENGDLERVVSLLRNNAGYASIGLHLHVNSVTRSIKVYEAVARYAAQIIQKYDFSPTYLDIGGGFFGGVPGKPSAEDYILAIKKEMEKVVNLEQTKLIIEPGSAIIASAVELHTSVTDVKDTLHARIVTTDGSRIHIDPLWLKKSYMYSSDAKGGNHPKQIVCGYTCMDHDRIMVLKNEPELSPGDRIIYYRVGNYTVTFGGPFIKPFPPVYVQNEKGIELIRKSLLPEELYRLESV